MELRIINGNVLRPDGFHAETLEVRDGRIVPQGTVQGGEVIDARGGWVIPGMIDMHVHGMGGGSAMKGEADVQLMARTMAKQGVTSFFPTPESTFAPQMQAALAGIRAWVGRETGGAAVLGAHVEGPFIGPELRGALDDRTFLPAAYENFVTLCGDYLDVVRRITVDPTLPGAVELIRALHEAGIVISLGHTTATGEQAQAGFAAGANLVTHLFNAMRPLHHREPSLLGVALSDENVYTEIITDFIHIHPLVVKTAIRAKGPEKMALITDAIDATGVGDGEYMLGGRKVLVRDGIARVPEGNLAGSTLTMDVALRHVVSLGFTLQEVATMASATVADVMGVADRGRLVDGNWADITVLDEELQVCHTIVEGKCVYSK